MKKPARARLAAALLGLAALFAAGRAASARPPPGAQAAAESRVTIPVEGLICASGSLAIRRALTKLDGVKRLEPCPGAGVASVFIYDAARVEPEQLVEAIDHLGFEAGAPGKGCNARAAPRFRKELT